MQRTLTDVENNEVRNWNVQQVLMWLKHTSSGMFEEYCPIFQENHVHGEALLSLNNEILRDEFEIKSYGKRFELLKAIQKLAKQSSSSSKGSPFNKSPNISRTYYKGMSNNNNNNKTMKSIKNDNWENLDVIATNTNMMDPAQYSQVINEITSDITGTEISKQTREKHSFYRKLSNLSLASQKRGSLMNKMEDEQLVNRNNSQSGGYQFDINIPNWDNIKITKVLQHSWDEILKKWTAKEIYVKIAPLPFSRGSLRMSYYCLNLGDDMEYKQKQTQHTQNNNGLDIKNDTMTNNNILFNKLIGNKNVFGGKLCVAKKNFGICDSIEAYFYDVRTQCESQKFANQYNKHNPPKKVAFLQASVIEVMDDNPESTEDIELYCLESFLHGSYVKHIDNHGGDEKNRNTPSAFAHFSYEASNKRLLVCDIQGVGDLYTDPQIHTYHGNGFGMGNLGNDGIIKFFKTHECNAICKHFKFGSTKNMGINEDLIYGTRPEKQYMKRKKIDVIDTSYIDDTKYLLQIPTLYHKNINANLPSPPAPIINYNQQTNINININHNKRVKDEKKKLLDGYQKDDNVLPPPPSDGESCCCGCVIL